MGRRWTDADLAKLPPGMVEGLSSAAKPAKAKQAPVKKTPPQLMEIMAWLRILNIDYVTEHRFHATRKWRFDVAMPQHMIAVEYEGVFSEKSRHTTIGGYLGDVRKYREATILGWRVLRYTANDYQLFMSDINRVLNGIPGGMEGHT